MGHTDNMNDVANGFLVLAKKDNKNARCLLSSNDLDLYNGACFHSQQWMEIIED